jgi:hypothetical protein
VVLARKLPESSAHGHRVGARLEPERSVRVRTARVVEGGDARLGFARSARPRARTAKQEIAWR